MLLKWITPSLAVCGPDWPGETFSPAEVTKAVDWIQMGHNAYVADEATAIEVLKGLGLTAEEVADRICFAASGNMLDTRV